VWSTLRGLLDGLESSSVVGLQWVRPTGDAVGWELPEVREVWLPDEREEASTGTLLFRVAAVTGLLGENGVFVADEVQGRRRRLVAI